MKQQGLGITMRSDIALGACALAAPTFCQAASETVIHVFTGQVDGNGPNSPLIEVGGKFYGTSGGGAHANGTVFSVDTAGNHVVLYNFKQAGTASWQPVGGLVELGGTLYGVTTLGGIHDGQGGSYGTIFSITPQGEYKQIYQFKSGPTDGDTPLSGLLVLGNLLYGTTSHGGQNGGGTVFSITPEGTESVLYSFKNNSDGYYPTSLITDGTMLYGTTQLGAGTDCIDSAGCGAIFMLDPQGNETTLHSFSNGDEGGNPYAPLLKSGEVLYGSTIAGGSNNLGTVFSLSLTGAYKDLHDFKGTDGEYPLSLVNVGGTLYGTAAQGGPNKGGKVFSITKKGKLTTIYSFQGGADGINPGDLLAVGDILYGTAYGVPGGKCYKADPPDCGTVFAVTP